MENYFSNKGMFKLLVKWKYHILVLLLISIIASAVFSSAIFIKPKFKSEAIVYPVNLGEYSEESHSEQMQQIFLSQEITDKVINELDLGKHYGIDSTYKYYLSTLYYEYGNNVKIRKTEFESIQITALDVDPQTACDIVNAIIEAYNEKVSHMHKIKYKEVVDIKKIEMDKSMAEINRLQEELNLPDSKTHNLSYDIQIEDIKQGNAKLITSGNNGLESLKETKLLYEYISHSKLKEEYDQALEGYEKNINYYQLVSSPFPADKKSYPVRWVIVLLSVLGTFFMSLIIISIIESIKRANKN